MKKLKIKKELKANILLIINIALSVITLLFDISLSGSVMNHDVNAVSLFLGLTLLMMSIYQCYLFSQAKSKRNKTRIMIVALAFLVASIIGFVARFYNMLFYFSTFIFTVFLGLNQFLRLALYDDKPNIPKKVTMILLGLTLLFLSFGVISDLSAEKAYFMSLLVMLLVLITTLKNLFVFSLKLDKLKLFVSIMIKTHLIDILIGLLALMISCSFLLPMVDENIPSFWEAMWYSFAIVTTIGFGDYVSVTLFGRIISVILGIYGIVVVAIITSVIVNFYTAVSVKEKEIKEVIKKEEN